MKLVIFWLSLTLGFSSVFVKNAFNISNHLNNFNDVVLIIGFILPILLLIDFIHKNFRRDEK